MSSNVSSASNSRMHAPSVKWRRRREFLPPRVGEVTLWRCQSQHEARAWVWLLWWVLGLGLTFGNFLTPAHAADPPRRVVSFNVCADQLVVALADPGQIAALSPHATNEVLSTVVEKARAYPRTGWTAESVVPFSPDLVLMGYSWDRSPTLLMLRALGLRLAPIGLVNDFDGALAQIHEVAALLGHPERGETLASDVAAARRRLANARQSTPSTALLVAQGGYTVGPTSLAAALMTEAGLTPPVGAPSGYGGFVPLEQLMTLRPDYLVMASAIETPDSQGALYLTHPALRGLYPPDRRVILPTRYTLCGGPSLVAALDYLTGVVARLATGR